MASTHPPPSAPPSAPPKSGGSGAFIGAAVVMLLLMGGLIYWKMQNGADETKAAVPPPAPTTPVLDEPPPPPPPEIDAGSAEAPKTPKRVVVSGGCDGECKGTAPGALQAALRTKAGQARGCYERALRQNATLEGRLSVNVRVGPRGQVCSASIGNDALNEPGVSQCVLQMFRSATLPLPSGGCVDTSVPMYFKPKS